jgi:hypothetical protein
MRHPSRAAGPSQGPSVKRVAWVIRKYAVGCVGLPEGENVCQHGDPVREFLWLRPFGIVIAWIGASAALPLNWLRLDRPAPVAPTDGSQVRT